MRAAIVKRRVSVEVHVAGVNKRYANGCEGRPSRPVRAAGTGSTGSNHSGFCIMRLLHKTPCIGYLRTIDEMGRPSRAYHNFL